MMQGCQKLTQDVMECVSPHCHLTARDDPTMGDLRWRSWMNMPLLDHHSDVDCVFLLYPVPHS